MGHFRALRAWQEARRLALLSNSAIADLPAYERSGLSDQWRRASYSVALNLAEGAARRSVKEFRRYVAAARGSLDEMEAIFDIVETLAYVEARRMNELKRVRENCARMVCGLLKKLDALVGS